MPEVSSFIYYNICIISALMNARTVTKHEAVQNVVIEQSQRQGLR